MRGLKKRTRTEDRIFEMQADLCRALAHPKRLKILHHLKNGEMTVGGMVKLIGGSQANLSQHLGVLRDRRLVTARRRGMNVCYAISNRKVADACDLIREALIESIEQERKSMGLGA